MQFISKALIRFTISAFIVHVSQPYKKTECTKALSKLNPAFMEMFLSLQIGFKFASVDVAIAILILISCTDLASLVPDTCDGWPQVFELINCLEVFSSNLHCCLLLGTHLQNLTFLTNFHPNLNITLFQSSC